MKLIEDDIKFIIQQLGLPVMDFEGKRILITGASGFLGSWFVAVFHYLNQKMFKKKCTVMALDSFIAADKNNALFNIKDENIEFIKADCSIYDFEELTPVDYIIHAAGIASPVYYRKYPVETIEGMVFGLSNLLKYSVNYPVKIKSFLNFSSSEMYGNPHPDKVPTKETYYGNVNCIGPRACYDEAKRLGETLCSVYHRIYNTPVKWVRPFNVYGPGMRVSDDRVVPKFMFQAIKNEEITVHSPGIQTRTFCYITDAMTGFFKVLLSDRNGEVYNIGSDKPEITMEDLALRVEKLFNKSLKIRKIPMPTEYPSDQAQRRCPDLSKAKEHLDYTAKVSLDNGLKKMQDYCIDIFKKL